MIRPLTVKIRGIAPSVNHMYGRTARGRVFLTAPAQQWRAEAIVTVKNVVNRCDWSLPDGLLTIDISFYFPKKYRGHTDADNRIKPTIDALAIALQFDDTRVHAGSWERINNHHTALTVVTIDQLRY